MILKESNVGSDFLFSHVSESKEIIQVENLWLSQIKDSEKKCQGPHFCAFLFNHVMSLLSVMCEQRGAKCKSLHSHFSFYYTFMLIQYIYNRKFALWNFNCLLKKEGILISLGIKICSQEVMCCISLLFSLFVSHLNPFFPPPLPFTNMHCTLSMFKCEFFDVLVIKQWIRQTKDLRKLTFLRGKEEYLSDILLPFW